MYYAESYKPLSFVRCRTLRRASAGRLRDGVFATLTRVTEEPKRIPNDSIPFEAPGESRYEKESREAEQILAKERAAARTISAKRKKKKK